MLLNYLDCNLRRREHLGRPIPGTAGTLATIEIEADGHYDTYVIHPPSGYALTPAMPLREARKVGRTIYNALTPLQQSFLQKETSPKRLGKILRRHITCYHPKSKTQN